MTARARRHIGISLSEAFPVNARGVLGRLIDPLPRGKPPHEIGIAVAARAHRDLRLAARRATEAARWIVCAFFLGCGGVPAMTVDACEAALTMDVDTAECRGGCCDALLLLSSVAGNAVVGG